MKLFSFFVVIALLVYSCSGDSSGTETTEEVVLVEHEIPEIDTFDYHQLEGIYIGDFGGSDIRVILNYVSQSKVIGYNIHKGLQRNISGKLLKSNDSIYLTLNEPGDNEFDGVFQMNLVGEFTTAKGNWKSNSGKIPSKNFILEKLKNSGGGSEEITVGNFSNNFGYMYDTTGNYRFSDDGLCVFEYYPETDSESRVEQLVSVKGSWTLKDQTVTIDWQPNEHFYQRKYILQIKKSEYGAPYLVDEFGNEIHNHFW